MLLSIRIWIGKKMYGKCRNTRLKRVSSKTIIKACEQSEVEAMEYVAKNTTIPIPRIKKKHRSGGYVYLEMDYIEGTNLNTLWQSDKLNDEQKNRILDEIAGYIRQLQSLKRPTNMEEGFVGSAFGNQCFDSTISNDPFGPFESVESFHIFRRRNVAIEKCTEVFNKEVFKVHSKLYKSVFTHGWLMPRNIIVDKNMKVAAILDWESAGWYPEYWEYTKAHSIFMQLIPGWCELLGKRMKQYNEELEAERCLRTTLLPYM